MKKFCSILLAALMLVSALPLGAVAAADAATITAASVGGYAGDTIEVAVAMADNPGMVGWNVSVSFDESAFELLSIQLGDAFPASGLSKGPLKSPASVTFADFVNPDVTANGLLFTLNLKIKADAPAGVYPLTVHTKDGDMENFCNADWATVPVTFVDGSIEVREHVSGVALDADHLDLKTGESAQLTASVTPATAYNKAVTWQSDNEAVATVAVDGTVTAHKFGTATITATTEDGGYTATALVNVTCSAHVYNTLLDGACVECGTPREVTQFDFTTPINRVYALGSALDLRGGYVDIAYADGAAGRVDLADATITGFDPNTVGLQTLTVAVGGAYSTYTVQVVEGAVPTIRVDVSPKGYIGKTITATVKVENNPGLVAMKLAIDYDTTKLELTEVKSEWATDFGPQDTAPFVANWVDAINPDVTTGGVFVTLVFTVKKDIEEGATSITVRYDEDDLFNYDLDGVLFNVVDGTTELRNRLPGDVNGDGKVNIRDVGIVQQYMNGFDTAYDMSAADVNGDGKVNIRDVGLYQQYLNGWDIEFK